MAKIYLVRHGQDEDNVLGILNGRRDQALSKLGWRQAETAASHIANLNLNIKKIYSSPLQRAFQTAEVISQKLGLETPEKLDLLIERDFGIMTGRPFGDIEKLCAPYIIKSNPITYFLQPLGAETFPQLIERAQELLNLLHEKHSDEDVLLVCHGDIGKMIYTAFYDLNWRDVLLNFHFGNSEILLLSSDGHLDDARIYQTTQYNQ